MIFFFFKRKKTPFPSSGDTFSHCPKPVSKSGLLTFPCGPYHWEHLLYKKKDYKSCNSDLGEWFPETTTYCEAGRNPVGIF